MISCRCLFLHHTYDRDFSATSLQRYCKRVPGPKLANMIEFGKTPILSARELSDIGYSIAVFPLTLLSANVLGMTKVEKMSCKF